MTTYFISDLHLQASQPALSNGFYQFVEKTITDATNLYILGDFFDAWIGDDEDDDFYLGVMNKLKSYTDNGLKIYFMHGNRDFLIGQAFAEKTGVTLLNDPTDIHLAGKKIRLMHGDSLCTTDTDYMQFRAQVRNPQWQQHILSLPLEQRRVMAAQLRAQSQSMNSNKAEDIMDVNPTDVIAQFEKDGAQSAKDGTESGIDILLHGHTHRPNCHPIESSDKKRIVLGDWGESMYYARADQTDITLLKHII